jgi:hypothetical protein
MEAYVDDMGELRVRSVVKKKNADDESDSGEESEDNIDVSAEKYFAVVKGTYEELANTGDPDDDKLIKIVKDKSRNNLPGTFVRPRSSKRKKREAPVVTNMDMVDTEHIYLDNSSPSITKKKKVVDLELKR